MPSITSYQQAPLKGKRVLMRVDFNVPMKDGVIQDATRITETMPGIEEILQQGASLILLSHWGRPKGVAQPDMSLAPVADYLSTLLKRGIGFAEDMPNLHAQAQNLQAGEVMLFENLRFWAGEEQNDPEFAKQLAQAGDIYINDAFATAHRAHASNHALAQLLPCFSGPLLTRELAMLGKILHNPTRPLAAIVGGAKISSKITLLKNLSEKADILVISGGMANMFLSHAGHKIGASLCESDAMHLVQEIIDTAGKNNTRLIIPHDAIVAREVSATANARPLSDFATIADDEMILDAGANSLLAIQAALDSAQTIIMNGPLGVFEMPAFATGTSQLCHYLAKRAQNGAVVVAGGGDTVSAVKQSGMAEKFTYLSTAGGAFLEWLEGKKLPGIEILN